MHIAARRIWRRRGRNSARRSTAARRSNCWTRSDPMDLSFSKEDLKFRDEVRAFIAERYDDDLKRKMSLTKNGYLDKPGQVKWQKALYDRGWAAVNWPKEQGGAGFTSAQKYIFDI